GMIDMTVTDDDVFDFVRIESDLWQSIRDFVFNGVIVNGINEDNSVGCVYGPRGIFRHPDEVEVVENFRGFRMPLRAIRRSRWLCRGALPSLGRFWRCGGRCRA